MDLHKQRIANVKKTKILDEIIEAGLKEIDSLEKESFHKIKNQIYKKYNIPKPFPSIEFIERYNEQIAS